MEGTERLWEKRKWTELLRSLWVHNWHLVFCILLYFRKELGIKGVRRFTFGHYEWKAFFEFHLRIAFVCCRLAKLVILKSISFSKTESLVLTERQTNLLKEPFSDPSSLRTLDFVLYLAIATEGLNKGRSNVFQRWIL